MTTKFSMLMAALCLAASASGAHADTASPPDAKRTRAEVRADLMLWLRAGLDEASLYDSYAGNPQLMQKRLVVYRQMRDGPEYASELARQQQMQDR